MRDQILKIIQENVPAIFGLIGVFFGGAFTFVAGLFNKKQEFRHKITETLLKKRIDSHEMAFKIAEDMRLMISDESVNSDGDLIRYPHILSNRNAYDNFVVNIYRNTVETRFWLTNDLVKELNLLQDYQINLSLFLNQVEERHYPLVGALIRQDFIDFSARIETKVKKYLMKDIFKASFTEVFNWHKYKPEETTRKLGETHFFKKRETIKDFLETKKDSNQDPPK